MTKLAERFWEKLTNYKNKKTATEVGADFIFNEVPNRKGFGEGLLLAGKDNPEVVALCADLTESTQVHLFKEAFPERFFEMGVAEQNMASVASGMAAMGKVPFIASYAMFSPGRNWEQIRTTIAYNNVPVKIIGAHAGVSVGPDGGTHQALEDIALMRAIPNMVVVVPADAMQAKKMTQSIARNGKPTYMRLAREKSPVIYSDEYEFELGKADILYTNEKEKDKKLGIIACGEMVFRSLNVVQELEEQGVSVGIMNLHTIKPLDERAIIDFVNKYQNILTCEEHQLAGGMGSAALECLAKNSDKINFTDFNIQMIGVDDEFGQSGTKEELFEVYKLNEKAILEKAKKLLKI